MSPSKKSTDPTKDPEFKRVLGNLLKAPHKTQAEMKIGKRKPPPPPQSKTKKITKGFSKKN